MTSWPVWKTRLSSTCARLRAILSLKASSNSAASSVSHSTNKSYSRERFYVSRHGEIYQSPLNLLQRPLRRIPREVELGDDVFLDLVRVKQRHRWTVNFIPRKGSPEIWSTRWCKRVLEWGKIPKHETLGWVLGISRNNWKKRTRLCEISLVSIPSVALFLRSLSSLRFLLIDLTMIAGLALAVITICVVSILWINKRFTEVRQKLISKTCKTVSFRVFEKYKSSLLHKENHLC